MVATLLNTARKLAIEKAVQEKDPEKAQAYEQRAESLAGMLELYETGDGGHRISTIAIIATILVNAGIADATFGSTTKEEEDGTAV